MAAVRNILPSKPLATGNGAREPVVANLLHSVRAAKGGEKEQGGGKTALPFSRAAKADGAREPAVASLRHFVPAAKRSRGKEQSGASLHFARVAKRSVR